MSRSSQESKLSELREKLAQLNSELFLTIKERRSLVSKIFQLKEDGGQYPHYDPERERQVVLILENELKALSIKELLAFSLIMEDQAQTLAPGSYPSWSMGIHLVKTEREIYQMINPLLLKYTHPVFFEKLNLSPDFSFLKQF
ncbi:MAG: chorismate mutase [Bacteriovoracaceae bacterium]